MRRLAILTLLMLALLPLRWFKVISSPAGTLYLHEIGLVLLSVVAISTVRLRVFARARDATIGFTSAMAAGFAVWAGSCLFAGISLASTLKQVGYLGSFLVVVGVFVMFAQSQDQTGIRVLRWAGLVTTCTLLVALALALAINHVNPATVLSSAIGQRNPSLIESQLFRPAFAGFGYTDADAVSQLRHEVFAGLLVSLLVASWAQHRLPFSRRSARWVSQIVVIVAGLLILLSLSRSVQLASIAWPLLAGLRVVVRGRITRRAMVSLGIVCFVLAVVTVTGILGVVVQRVTQDSSSYDERGAKFSAAVDTIGQYPWLGGHYDDSISSHNFVIDAWLRGGIVMAALMLVALLIVVRRLVTNVFLLGAAPTAFVAVTAALVLPLVRMFTIGAGLMTPPEWVALAFGFAGTIVHQHEVAARRARQQEPAPQEQQRPAPQTGVVSGAHAVPS